MAYPHYDLVQKAYNELVAEGEIIALPPGHQEEVEAQKGLLTQRSGYYSNLRDSNIGVLEKTSGNNYKGYSTDILIHHDGTFWDIATDDGRQALPVNGGPQFDPALASRWRQPTKELAGLENGEPIPEPEPPPNDDVLELLNHIVHQNEVIIAQNTAIQGHLDAQDATLQLILNKPSEAEKFKITYPNYTGRLFGVSNVTLTPEPRENP